MQPLIWNGVSVLFSFEQACIQHVATRCEYLRFRDIRASILICRQSGPKRLWTTPKLPRTPTHPCQIEVVSCSTSASTTLPGPCQWLKPASTPCLKSFTSICCAGLGCHLDGATPQFSSPASVRPESQRNACTNVHHLKEKMPDNDQRAFSAPGHIIVKVYALVIAVTKERVIVPCADQLASSFTDKPYKTNPCVQYWLLSKALDGHQHWFTSRLGMRWRERSEPCLMSLLQKSLLSTVFTLTCSPKPLCHISIKGGTRESQALK